MEKFAFTMVPILLFLSCANSENHSNTVMGTWTSCTRSGGYNEFKITEDYAVFMSSADGEMVLFKKKVKGNYLILSSWILENNPDLLGDSLVVKPQFESNGKLKLVVFNPGSIDTLLLNKKKLPIKQVDFTNFNVWRNETLSEFKKRAQNANCKDIRTEEEKSPLEIHFESIEDDVVPIIEKNKY